MLPGCEFGPPSPGVRVPAQGLRQVPRLLVNFLVALLDMLPGCEFGPPSPGVRVPAQGLGQRFLALFRREAAVALYPSRPAQGFLPSKGADAPQDLGFPGFGL